MKDPAFLFYSKDFYEGTRMMLPEERACYIDLLIYQHQNGVIPNDLRRLVMYCSGCGIEVIEQVLNQKFKQTVNGWLNERLTIETENRSFGKPKKIASATFAGLISANKLSKKDVILLKQKFQINDFIKENDEVIIDETLIKSKVKEWFNKMLNQMVKNLANANAIANAIEDKNKDENENEKNENLIFPFETENFKVQWNLWKIYKQKEFGFKYKSEISEQAALKELANKSFNNEKTAIEIIHQSMSKGWKGFFELKDKTNANYKNGQSHVERMQRANQLVDDFFDK